MARSTASSSTRGAAAASTTGRRSSGQRGRGQQGRGSASSGAIAAAAAAHAASAAADGNSVDILEAAINPNHAADIRETTAHEMDAETEKDHRRRQREIMEWIKKEYPEQYDHCVIELTAEQKSNPDNKYYASTHDFVYERVNPTTIKAFLSSEKKYKDETRTTQYSHVHIRKYHDSLLFGRKTIGAELPQKYHTEMKAYLKSVRKEKQTAKAEGNLDEEDADPITFPLYEHMCNWFIEDNDVLSWAFTVTQWNCMARSINIDPLGFHNMSQSQMDAIRVIRGK